MILASGIGAACAGDDEVAPAEVQTSADLKTQAVGQHGLEAFRLCAHSHPTTLHQCIQQSARTSDANP